MRVMANARLVDNHHGTAHRPITLLHDGRVFCDRNHGIRIAHDVNKRDSGIGERLQNINWIAAIGQGFSLILELVALQQCLPIRFAEVLRVQG